MRLCTCHKMGSSSNSPLPHIAIFPFMSKGHTIPLLHLAHLLHHRRLVSHVTFFTTPLNAPFIRSSLTSSAAAQNTSIVTLPFPDNLPDNIPPGIESTDQLSSIELFLPFVTAMPRLRPAFSEALSHLSPPPSLLISDNFLGWTQYVATEHGIPRLMFSGMGGFAQTMYIIVGIHKPHAKVSSPYESFAVPGFPHLSLTKADLEPPFDDPEPKGLHWEFVQDQVVANNDSLGQVVNSFFELESPYFDYVDSLSNHKNYRVGPFCLARWPDSDNKSQSSSPVMQWLDTRLATNRPVLYVSFGSQVKLSLTQMKELAIGLERSELDFIWVVRNEKTDWDDGFEEQVGDRCRLVKWAEQMEVLSHKAVHGFISHCGWNSLMESICAGVPVLAWPMMAEQRMNAKFAVEELRMGLRICTSDGTKHGLVKAEDVVRLTRELLVGEEGKAAKKKAEELAAAARRAMSEGGSSYLALEKLIGDICADSAN